MHTDPAGLRDIDISANARVYHFAGTEHGAAALVLSDTRGGHDPPERPQTTQNLHSIVDYRPLLRASLHHLLEWTRSGAEPPPSCHPRVDDGSAVPPSALLPFFDTVPPAHYPSAHALPRWRDFQPDPATEHAASLPPEEGDHYGSLVSAVDSTGNEIAGIRLPEISVPLA